MAYHSLRDQQLLFLSILKPVAPPCAGWQVILFFTCVVVLTDEHSELRLTGR